MCSRSARVGTYAYPGFPGGRRQYPGMILPSAELRTQGSRPGFPGMDTRVHRKKFEGKVVKGRDFVGST